MATRTPTPEAREASSPPRHRTRVYIGLGSNLGDSAGRVAEAIRELTGLPGVRLAGVSRLYATAPIGVVDQPQFRNAVVALDVTSAAPPEVAATDLLVELKRLERELGRRPSERWGPREIDLDLLLFGRNRLALDRPPRGRSADALLDRRKVDRLLEVPHRDAAERLFVLAPLADLAPRLVPPGWHETVESGRRRRLAVEGTAAVRPVAGWDARSAGWSPFPG
ncbi:MAG TPA: 2-amino-4-hydroxy-6-hydroxymethyldihydropteridine diphosphokinase [Candidatus Saccharimonadales bacterium]|nr:2-amino-4-hydroxy-6-hydroxymethyldihydropteridine diphosphokinase [Candidatus Saccharimonadales bacterium]